MLHIDRLTSLIQGKHLEQFEADILTELDTGMRSLLKETLKKYANKNRIVKNDNEKVSHKALDILTPQVIATLPKWVHDDIAHCEVIGSSNNIIRDIRGKKYHLKNKLNDLSWAEWTFFLNSVISTRYPTTGAEWYAHDIRKIHPSPKPPQLMEEIIRFFTKENEIILDYFMWVGWSLLGASLANRRALGIDLEKRYIDTYEEASLALWLEPQRTLEWDSMELLSDTGYLQSIYPWEEFSLILIDPPYWDMLSRARTWESVKQRWDTSPTPFTQLDADLGNLDWDEFSLKFYQSINDSLKLLKNNWHLVIFIKDLQPDGKQLNLFHAELIQSINTIPEIKYLWTKIWADQSVNLYPYGYPFSYVANQVHQYILIFKKVTYAKS
jgi:DNA modification methylase